MIEEWKTIKEFPRYEVSNLGNVRSNIGVQKQLQPYTTAKGYLVVRLFNKPAEKGKYNSKDIKVHRLVAAYFCENYAENKEIHHINHDKTDNKATNLLCLTKKEHIELHNKEKMQQKEEAAAEETAAAIVI